MFDSFSPTKMRVPGSVSLSWPVSSSVISVMPFHLVGAPGSALPPCRSPSTPFRVSAGCGSAEDGSFQSLRLHKYHALTLEKRESMSGQITKLSICVIKVQAAPPPQERTTTILQRFVFRPGDPRGDQASGVHIPSLLALSVSNPSLAKSGH